MSTTTVAINCLVFGEDETCAFTVWISPEAFVGQLKGLIKGERPKTFHDVDAASLRLCRMPREHRGRPPRPDELEALHPLTPVRGAFPDPPPTDIHVLVSCADDYVGGSPASTPDIQLWCVMDGDDPKVWAFKVRMEREADVDDLKHSIKQEQAARLDNVAAARIVLYQAVDEADSSEPAWRPLDPRSRLVDVFSESLLKRKSIHVRVLGERVSGAWSALPEVVAISYRDSSGVSPTQPQEDVLGALTTSFLRLTSKESRIPTPSQAAKSLGYLKHQAGDMRLLDGRFAVSRRTDTAAPRIQLFNPAFAHFSSKAFDPGYNVSDDDVCNVGELMSRFAPIYANEDARRAAISSAFGKVLRRPLTMACNGDKTAPDFLVLSSVDELQVHLVVGEEKNEFGDGSSDPSIQGSFSFLRIHRQDENKEVRLRCSCPAFIVAHAGPWLAVLGAVITGNCIVQRLTDFLWVPAHSVHDEAHCFRLTRVLCALRESLTLLDVWYQGVKEVTPLSTEGSPTPPHPRFFPTPAAYDDKGTLVRFTYETPLEGGGSCVTFLARTVEKNPKNVVVKFVVEYGEEAHRHMASIGYAPQLLYCGRIDVEPGQPSYGDQRMVVMEYLEGHTLHDGLDRLGIPSQFPDDLNQALCELHSAGYVFGDVRPPNIFVTPTRKPTARLIDFDWAGKERQARYPMALSPDIKWPNGVRGRAYIRKEHDLAMLAPLLDKAKMCIQLPKLVNT